MNTLTMNVLNVVHAVALPNPDAERPPGFEFVDTLLAWMKWGGLILAIFALIGAAAMLMFNQRPGSTQEGVGAIGKILIAVIIIGAASSIIGFIA